MTPSSMLAQWVATPSLSGEEGQVADLAEQHLMLLGLETWRIKNNVIARKEGEGRGELRRLLLVSHLDTVPIGEGWTGDPHNGQWVDHKLIGRGSNDAKGCAAAMAYGLSEAKEFDGEITLILAAEEEIGGSNGIALALSQLGEFDAAIVGEPTELRVCTAQRGMLVLKFVAKGVASHVAHASGVNAIHMAARDIAKLEALRFEADPVLGEMRAQVVTINGGEARNMVPSSCEFFVDFRTTPNVDVDTLVKRVVAMVESDLGIHSERYVAKSTPLEHPILMAALKHSPCSNPIGSTTVSDWAFLGDIPAVKVGPGDTKRSHTTDEYLFEHELISGVDYYKNVIESFFKEVNG